MNNPQCDIVQNDMMAYLDRALTTSEAFAVEHHLDACPPCQEELEALQAMDESLQALGNSVTHNVSSIDIRTKVSEEIAALAHAAQKTRLTKAPDEATLQAYLEDDLDTRQTEQVAQFIATQPHIRQELLGIGAIEADLEAIAAEEAQFRLDDDLTDSVMRTIRHRQADNIFAERRTARTWLGAALVAASLLAAWGLYALVDFNNTTTPPQTASNTQDGTDVTLTAHPTNEVHPSKNIDSPQETIATLKEPELIPGTITPTSIDVEDTPPPPKRRGGFREAVGLYRLALLKDVQAMESIVGWATLAPAESRILLADGNLSPEAEIGLSDFLPEDEAVPILEASVRANPQDPYLRAKLAQRYAAQEGHSADQRAQLEAWSELDPDNSLPHFLAAQSLLAQNDTEGALAALDQAMARNLSDAFSRASALDREQALLASGTDPEVARFLAVATAGTQEYTDYITLGGSLLQFGEYYATTNQNEIAEQVMLATQQLGTQITSSATLANEQVAGFDIQLEALNALRSFYDLIEAPAENSENLLARTSEILYNLAELANFFAAISELFTQSIDANIADILSAILNGGDLNILELFGN